MKLELITLTGIKVNDDVYEVVVPTRDGDIGVLPGHVSLVTLAVPGVMFIRHKKSDMDMEPLVINGGVVEISPERVRVLVDEAESADDIVAADAEAALEKAKKLRASATSQLDINEAEALMGRHAARIKVAGLRRRR